MRMPSLKTSGLILLVIIISIVLLQMVLHLFPQKITGSFEYIRKGEDLIDKGKSADSIKYFEKAYESSPENETIKSELVYAYSACSKALADKNKYDEAIDYLAKAYNVAPSASTTQNLAMMYSTKALHEAQKGDLMKAKIIYDKMRSLTDGLDSVSKNIAILLYNDGISEYKSGREDTAILCLKESSSTYKDSRISELLGDLYYKHAEFNMARFYWHEAKTLDPGNAALAEKLNKVNKEMSLATEEEEEPLSHFDVRYKKDLPVDKELASEMLEKAYADVGKDLGYFPKAKTKIFFYSKEDFRKIFNMPYIVNAFYDGSIKVPAPETLLDRTNFSHYIYHEYTHAIVSAKTNNNCPPWFSEGVAVWEEFRGQRQAIEEFFAKIKQAPDISMKFLDESFKTDKITNDKALSYMVSYTLVNYIIDNWGVAGLQGILKRLGNKQHIVNAIDDEFLLSEKEFEKKWREYALNKYFNNINKFSR